MIVKFCSFCEGKRREPNNVVPIFVRIKFGCNNKIMYKYLLFQIIFVTWFEVDLFYPWLTPVSATPSKPGEYIDSCQALNLSVTLWASCPLHPLVHPVAQAYSAGEGLSQKPTSTVPVRPPSSTSPCAPSFIHPTLQPLCQAQCHNSALWRCSWAAETSAWTDYSSIQVFPQPLSRLPPSWCILHRVPAPFCQHSTSPVAGFSPCFLCKSWIFSRGRPLWQRPVLQFESYFAALLAMTPRPPLSQPVDGCCRWAETSWAVCRKCLRCSEDKLKSSSSSDIFM